MNAIMNEIQGRHTMLRQSRRAFFGASLAGSALAMSSCGGSKQTVTDAEIPVLHDTAPEGEPLRAALVGCGGRGTGAALNFIKASPNCEVVALADVFQDRIDSSRKKILEEGGQTVPESNCFVGFDAYRRVLDLDIDVFLHATPPHFRPEHFRAAVDAGKHCFIEKPAGVDPLGIKEVIEAGGQARTKGLTVIAGTCWRHHKKVIETYRKVAEGAIGRLLSANAWFNVGQLWYRERQEGWSDMEWMIRDWVNWCWLSGDHIVEQHVHNLDTVSLFLGIRPANAVGFGARQRRVTGDQYDMFAVDFSYENGLHLTSMCRQIDGCRNNVSDYITGTDGATDCRGMIWNPDGSVQWNFDDEFPPERLAEMYGDPEAKEVRSMYDQEHVDLVTSIRTSEARNEIVDMAESTLMGVMGRESAYTGRETTRQQMLDSDMRLGPTDYSMGSSDIAHAVSVPVPGATEA